MQTSKQWTHQRRARSAADPIDALIAESISVAAAGKVLNATRLVRFAEQITALRKKRRPPITIERPPLPQRPPLVVPTPPAPAPAPVLYRPPPRVTDPPAFTPEEEARFAAIRAARQAQERNDPQ